MMTDAEIDQLLDDLELTEKLLVSAQNWSVIWKEFAKKLRFERKRLQRLIADLSVGLSETRQVRDEYAMKVERLEAQVRSLEARRGGEASVAVIEARRRAEQLRKELIEQSSKMAALAREKAQVEIERDQAKEAFRRANDDHDMSERALRNQLRALGAERDALNAELADMKSERVKRINSEQGSEIQSLSAHLTQREQEIERWRKVTAYYVGEFALTHGPEECYQEMIKRVLGKYEKTQAGN